MIDSAHSGRTHLMDLCLYTMCTRHSTNKSINLAPDLLSWLILHSTGDKTAERRNCSLDLRDISVPLCFHREENRNDGQIADTDINVSAAVILPTPSHN